MKISPFFILTWAGLIWLNGFSSVWTLFCAAALHECGHIVAFILCGAPVEHIKLLSFGASVKLKNEACIGCGKEIFVSLAGIAVNLVCIAVLLGVPSFPVSGDRTWTILCHGMLAAVNLLPIAPLDGGRALYFLLLKRLSPDKAKNVSTWVGFAFLIPVGVFSVYVFVFTGYNFSLMLISLYLFLCLFIKR